MSLPPEFLDQAFVGRDGTMYGIHYEPPREAKYDTVPRRFDIMLTPIPYRHWSRTARLTIRMHHRPAMIREISDFLGKQGVAIIQAESTRSGYRYDTWSFYIVFEHVRPTEFDARRSLYVETFEQMQALTTRLEEACSAVLFRDENDIDLQRPVIPSYNTALAYFHNHVETARRNAATPLWIHEPFEMTCRGAGQLESSRGDSELAAIVDYLQRTHRVHLDPSAVFTSFHTHYLNLRAPIIPTEDLPRFQEVIVDYSRLGSTDSCLGLIAHITSRFRADFNVWSFHSRTFENNPGHERGRLVFVLRVDHPVSSNPTAELVQREVESSLAPLSALHGSFSIDVSVHAVTINRVRRKIKQAAMARGTYDVFLSYCSDDVEQAQKVKAALRTEGVSCFMADDEIMGGDQFNESILDALKESREMCVLFTPSSKRSEWVTTEWGAAWALNKPITPILWRTSPADLPPRLQARHAKNHTEIVQYAVELKRRLDSAQLG